MSDRPLFNRAAVIGVGLIGGSLARAMKNRGIAQVVVGSGRSRQNIDKALQLGIIDEALSAEEAVKDADFVIICTPPLSIVPTLEKIAPHIKEGALVTDAGSTKREIAEKCEKISGGRFSFIGSHPIAGTEKSGADASFDTLFEDRHCIVTPLDGANAQALAKLKKFWAAAGMEVVEMDPASHDRIMSAVSHLPHMAAYALVNTICDENLQADVSKFAAGGFKDFTRIAASSPEMWADIALSNADEITGHIGGMKKQLGLIETAIKNGDREELMKMFERSKNFRQKLG